MALQVLQVVFTLMTKGKPEVKVVVAAAAAASSLHTYNPAAHCPKVNKVVLFNFYDFFSIDSENKNVLQLQ